MRLAWIAALVALGCGPSLDEAPPSGPRIALTSDFESFRDWRAVRLPDASATTGHESAPERWLYIDREPPPIDAGFALGTILVKTIEGGAPESWEIHAMVKRGDEFNAEGAVDWEFFELDYDDAERLRINWRGTGDDHATYVDSTGVMRACNFCHAFGAEEDYVFSRRALEDARTGG